MPILALTASVMVHDRELYLASGMDRCLTKPIIWPELFTALAAVAAGRPLIETLSPAEERPASSSTPETPLLDSKMLAGLASNLPPEPLEKVLRRALDGAEQSCGRLHAARHDPAMLAQEAHRLRGIAGSFGLARVSALAGAIEDRLQREEDVADILVDLTMTVAASRLAVAKLGLDARTE